MSVVWQSLLDDVCSLSVSPECFICVGVGPGRESWAIAERHPGIQIVGFEPHSQCEIPDYPGRLIRKAAWSTRGILQLREHDFSGGASTVFVSSGKIVRATTVDDECRECKNGILWADCEGAELEVLKGATSLLTNFQIRWIVLEVRNESKWNGGCTYSQLDKFLSGHGFIEHSRHGIRESGNLWDAIYKAA